MTIAALIGQRATDLDTKRRCREFVRLGMFLAEASAEGAGGFATALEIAQRNRATSSILDALGAAVKTAVPVSDTSSWAALAPYRQLADAFVATLREHSSFDAILATGAFRRGAMHSWILSQTSFAIASEVGEGKAKPLTSLSLGRDQLKEQKVVGQAVETTELRRFSPATAASNIESGLQRAVGVGTDTVFVDILKSAAGWSNPSSGMTQTLFLSDLDGALAAMDLGSDARVFAITSPTTCRTIAMMHDGGFMFAGMGINGGQISGVQIIPSDAVNDDIIVVDASQIVVDDIRTVLSTTDHADLVFDTAPTDGAAQRVSLWQANLFAVKAERSFAVLPLASEAVSVITGISPTTA